MYCNPVAYSPIPVSFLAGGQVTINASNICFFPFTLSLSLVNASLPAKKIVGRGEKKLS